VIKANSKSIAGSRSSSSAVQFVFIDQALSQRKTMTINGMRNNSCHSATIVNID